ncbi:hypothetical protein JCM1840_001029 [Sporobolomyces johnsonii]
MDTGSRAPPPDRYTVIARDIPFSLSRSQIETDSPNFFTAAFLEHDFAEASSRRLRVDTHPKLFALIVDYLSGYDILPLTDKTVPDTMSVDVAMKNLLKDADYFQLDSLSPKLATPPPAPPWPRYF